MREATDLGISAGVRRELSGRRIDLSKIKFPVKAGAVTLQGELCFVGIDKTTDETAVELKFIESSLRGLPGVKDVIFELTDWRRSDSGAWESTSSTAFSLSGPGTMLDGDGIVCPECDNVIRFCPCCGKPLAGAAKSATGRPRKLVIPVRPIIKKKYPVNTSPVIKPAAPVQPPTNFSTPPTPPIAPPVPIRPTMPAKPVVPSQPAPVKPVAPTPLIRPPAAKPLFTAKPAVPAIPPVAIPAAPKVIPVAPEVPEVPEVPDISNLSDIPDVPDFGSFSLAIDSAKTEKPVEPKIDKNANKPAHPVKDVPDFNFDDLLSSSDSDSTLPDNASPGEAPAFDFESLGDLDATPADSPIPGKNLCNFEPPAMPDDDTPLPPMRPALPKTPRVSTPPAAPEVPTGFEDDDTPLPPMRSQTPPAKKHKDPFAALFSETELNFGLPGENSGQNKDPFGNIDLELDVLEVFPGKKPPAPAKPAPADDNPFNLDNIIDLDSPVEDKSPSKKKGTKDPFDLDDFDISKFKI